SCFINKSLARADNSTELTNAWAQALVLQARLQSDAKAVLADLDNVFSNPEERRSAKGELKIDLAVEIKEFLNIVKGKRVRLRSYNGQLVGPTIRVKPGDTLRVNLRNHLPLANNDPLRGEGGKNAPPDGPKQGHNRPNGF